MRTVFLVIPLLVMIGCASHLMEKRFDRNFFHFFERKAPQVIFSDTQEEPQQEEQLSVLQEEVNDVPQPIVEAPEEPLPFDEQDLPQEEGKDWWSW